MYSSYVTEYLKHVSTTIVFLCWGLNDNVKFKFNNYSLDWGLHYVCQVSVRVFTLYLGLNYIIIGYDGS